jgi:uncharacterized protein YqgQ
VADLEKRDLNTMFKIMSDELKYMIDNKLIDPDEFLAKAKNIINNNDSFCP